MRLAILCSVIGGLVLSMAGAPTLPARTVESGCGEVGASWSGGTHWMESIGGGLLSFSSCSSGTSHFDFECQPGAPDVSLSIVFPADEDLNGKAADLKVSVDGRTFIFPGRFAFDKASSSVRPVARFPRNHEVFNALLNGRTGGISVKSQAFEFDLDRARPSIRAMLDTCPAGGQSAASASPTPAPVATQQSFDGPCVRGYGWSGRGSSSGGSVLYQGCGDGEYTFSFGCQAGSREITLDIELGVSGARDGAEVTVPVIAGKKRFDLRGTAAFNEMSGGMTPSVRFDRGNGLIAALQEASSARMLLGGGQSFRFHLSGTRKAFDAMLAACPVE